MALNISAWSIRNPIPGILLFTVLMILGLYSFQSLPITRFPNIDAPFVNVRITQSGAAPTELETQVTKRIEDAVASLAGVKHITSAVSDGASSTTIEFRLEIAADRAVNDVKDAIAKIRADLPRTIDEPITQRVDIAGLPILTFAVYAPAKTLEQVSWFVDDVVIRNLQAIRGVGGVERIGGVEREIRVQLDPDRLAAMGVTAGDVNRQLRATNVDLAGGRSEVAGREQSIRTLAGAQNVDSLAATTITLPGNRKVRLSDLGKVEDSAAEQRTFARLDGRPVVAFSISRSKGASDAEVEENVRGAIAALNERHADVDIRQIDSYVAYTIGNYKSAMKTLIEGSLLAILVVLVFLRDFRATVISAIAIPLSIFPTFWAMSQLGFSLNLVSLLAMTLATGVLVDDAIVEVENISRHMHMGKSAYRAALEAADEIGLAVIAISFTIVAIFAPVSFMSGIAGQYFKQFGLVVAVAVIFSLLVARLITPLLAAYFMKAPKVHKTRDGAIMRGYTRFVAASVRWRWLTIIAGVGLLVVTFWSTRLLPSGFLPGEDVARSLMAVELPPGSTLAQTIQVSDDIVARLKKRPEVKSVFVEGGKVISVGAASREVRKAQIVINFVHKDQRKISQKQLEVEIGEDLKAVPDIRYWFMKDNGMRGVQMVVQGQDGEAVSRSAAALASQMKTLPILSNVTTTAALDRPEIRVRPRADVAADLGVSTDAISEAVRVATIGDVGPNLARFNAGDRLVPIRVQLVETARLDIRVIETLKVMSARGVALPLMAVAEIEFGQGPTSIDRYDRVRRVAVEADLVGTDALGLATSAIRGLPAVKEFPPGVQLAEFGDAEVMKEVFQSFGEAMGAGLMMVLVVLILLFHSVMQPITILLSLPFSIGGVIIALLVTNKAISMPVVIGILMLMGIVTKNAIMLVDFAVEQMAKGMPRTEAIVDAGRKRARPIIMTTIAMGAGMVPSALALGDGGEFRAPMAIGVIGGLIVSTILSLVFVPSVFTVMDDVGRGFAWLFSKIIGPTDEPEAAVPPAIVVSPEMHRREEQPSAPAVQGYRTAAE